MGVASPLRWARTKKDRNKSVFFNGGDTGTQTPDLPAPFGGAYRIRTDDLFHAMEAR